MCIHIYLPLLLYFFFMKNNIIQKGITNKQNFFFTLYDIFWKTDIISTRIIARDKHFKELSCSNNFHKFSYIFVIN